MGEGALLGESKLLSMGGVVATRQDNNDNIVFFKSNSFLNNQSINNNDNNINISNNFNNAYDNDKTDANGGGESRLGIDNDGCNLMENNDQSKDFDII